MTIEKILKLTRKEVRDLPSYGGEFKIPKKSTFLKLNENPFGLFINKKYNRYPKLRPFNLKKQVAKLYKTKPESVLLGRGSVEIIDLLIKTFCRPYKDKIVVCSPTFFIYKRFAAAHGCKTINIPLQKRDYQLNVSKIIKEGKKKDVKLIFIPNPSAIYGNLMNKKDLIKIIKKLKNNCYVVIDEAYIEFSGEKSFIKNLKKYPNMGILRTLSKYYGLADLRVGAFVGHPKITDTIDRILLPYYLPRTNCKTIKKVLSPKNLKKRNVLNESLIKERERMILELETINFIKKVNKTKTNFITIIAKDSEKIIKYLANHKVFVSNQSGALKNCIRITIGTKKENNTLLKILKSYKGK